MDVHGQLVELRETTAYLERQMDRLFGIVLYEFGLIVILFLLVVFG